MKQELVSDFFEDNVGVLLVVLLLSLVIGITYMGLNIGSTNTQLSYDSYFEPKHYLDAMVDGSSSDDTSVDS